MFSSVLLALIGAQVASSHMVMNTPMIYSPENASTWPSPKMDRSLILAKATPRSFIVPLSLPAGQLLSTSLALLLTVAELVFFGLNYHSTPTFPYSSDPEHYKTIYTIIGGCPAETLGNLLDGAHFRGNDPNGNPDSVHCGNDTGKDCIRQFNIPFPAGNCSQAPVAPFASAGNSMPTPALFSTSSGPSLTVRSETNTTATSFSVTSTTPITYSLTVFASNAAGAPASSSVTIPASPSSTTPIAPPKTSGTEATVSAAASATPIGDGRVDCDVSPGTLVCLGEKEFGICDANGKAYPQSLNDHQICIGGHVIYN